MQYGKTVQKLWVAFNKLMGCRSCKKNWAQSHGSAYRRIQRLRSRFHLYVQAPNFCASLLSVDCLLMLSTHVQKPKLANNPWNTLAVSTEFPPLVSADSMLTVSRAMKLGTEGLDQYALIIFTRKGLFRLHSYWVYCIYKLKQDQGSISQMGRFLMKFTWVFVLCKIVSLEKVFGRLFGWGGGVL